MELKKLNSIYLLHCVMRLMNKFGYKLETSNDEKHGHCLFEYIPITFCLVNLSRDIPLDTHVVESSYSPILCIHNVVNMYCYCCME